MKYVYAPRLALDAGLHGPRRPVGQYCSGRADAQASMRVAGKRKQARSNGLKRSNHGRRLDAREGSKHSFEVNLMAVVFLR